MNPTNNRKFETLIYSGLWLLAIVLFLLDIMRGRSYTTDLPLLDFEAVARVIFNLLPFMALFALNNYLLIPRLLKRGRYSEYLLSTIALVAVIWICQRIQFHGMLAYSGEQHPIPPHDGRPQPLMPLPLFLDVIYDVLIIGVNLAISLMFQHFEDRFEQELLMKDNAQNQLTYLKAQINPHFYMNMLNNIHGMIEINPVKAQDMVIEMSGLMRYMLYESSRPEIELSAEVGFIRNYVNVMRERYPEDVVSIVANLPEESTTAGIKVPPLLFLVFIENAFKHGISYSGENCFISISLTVNASNVIFQCMNSAPQTDNENKREGIGLDNVKRRMDIIYGHNYHLDIEPRENVYSVNLTLPYENKNTGN